MLCKFNFLFKKKSYISPFFFFFGYISSKLIEWKMEDTYVTNIKGDA